MLLVSRGAFLSLLLVLRVAGVVCSVVVVVLFPHLLVLLQRLLVAKGNHSAYEFVELLEEVPAAPVAVLLVFVPLAIDDRVYPALVVRHFGVHPRDANIAAPDAPRGNSHQLARTRRAQIPIATCQRAPGVPLWGLWLEMGTALGRGGKIITPTALPCYSLFVIAPP